MGNRKCQKNYLTINLFYQHRKKRILEDIERLAEWIKETNFRVVAMESRGVYWKPVYNTLESEGIELIIVNAQHIKAVPGRKTDVKDAEWIVDIFYFSVKTKSAATEVTAPKNADSNCRQTNSMLHYKECRKGGCVFTEK